MLSKSNAMTLAVGLLAVSLSTGAAPIPGTSFTSGSWSGGAYTSDDTGKFSHCAVAGSFDGGDMLMLGIGADYSFVLSIGNQNWHFEQGKTYPVKIKIDNYSEWSGNARVVTDSSVSMVFRDAGTIFKEIQSGNGMRITTPATTLRYSLPGTREALRQTADCTYAQVNSTSTADSARNPFQRQPSAARQSPGNDERSSLLVLVTNILSRSGMTGFKMLSPNEIPDSMKAYQVVWTKGNVLGAAASETYTGEGHLNNSAAQLIASDAASCKGKFGSGRLPQNSAGVEGLRIFTACSEASDNFQVDYSLLRVGSKVYTLVTAQRGEVNNSEGEQKELNDSLVRQAVYELNASNTRN